MCVNPTNPLALRNYYIEKLNLQFSGFQNHLCTQNLTCISLSFRLKLLFTLSYELQEFSFCFRFDEKSHLNWTIAMSQHRIEYFDEASSVPKVFFLFHLISLALSFVSTPISQHSRHSIYISTVSS